MPALYQSANSQTVADGAAPRLDTILANRRWRKRLGPFPHVTAENVFQPDFYLELENAFRDLLVPGLAGDRDPARFSRNTTGYAAHSILFSPRQTGPFSIFVSRAWHDLIAGLAGVEAKGDMNGGLHHHQPGNPNGWIHNDLNPGWFVDNTNTDKINVYDSLVWDYKSGSAYGALLPVRETIRAATMIFYLNNPPWKPGYGGETGLYLSPRQPVEQPTVAVPPVNNSIVLFECTPHSYHSFIANRYQERNSVILWLHRPKAEVISRWGADKIVYWPAG